MKLAIKTLPLALTAAAVLPAHAATQAVEFNVLNATAMLPTAFMLGDSLLLDTTVTQGMTGALSQQITFTLAAGVTSLLGQVTWAVSTAAGPGPRLVGVNIDIVDAGNNVVASDSFAGVLGGFAVSTLSAAVGPGTYRMVVTGTAVRDTVLDVAVNMVPEPRTYGLMLAGLGVLALLVRRRIR